MKKLLFVILFLSIAILIFTFFCKQQKFAPNEKLHVAAIPECDLLIQFEKYHKHSHSKRTKVVYESYRNREAGNIIFNLYDDKPEAIGSDFLSVQCGKNDIKIDSYFRKKSEILTPDFLSSSDWNKVVSNASFYRSTGNGSTYGVTNIYTFKKGNINYLIDEFYMEEDIHIFKTPRITQTHKVKIKFGFNPSDPSSYSILVNN